MNPQRALVTGGAGFLGSHLCDALLGEGYSVVVVDNLLTGRRANIDHLRNDSRFEFINKDICEPFDVGPVGYVFHLASPASPVDYSNHGIETLKVGSLGTFHALDVAHKYGAKYFVSSTSECYGDPLEHPQKETYWGNVNPVGPRGVYDEAKRFAEAMTMAYHRFHGIDTKIVRIFNTYGPRMRLRDGRGVPAVIRQGLNNDPLTVFGDGSRTRSLCYVSDLIEGIFRLAMSEHHGPVNIGNPVEMTIKQFAEKILQITGATAGVEFRDLPVDDPKVRQPDITRARAQLNNWGPKVEFDEGIRVTIDYFRKKLQSDGLE